MDDRGRCQIDLLERLAAKASHGCGWNIVCEDKSHLDVEDARKKLNKWLELNYYYFYREKQYRKCPPRIVIEQHLKDICDTDVRDHKFYCFNGLPRFVQIDVERDTNHRQAFYDMDWNKQHFHQLYPPYEEDLPVPDHYDEMQEIARKLSAGLPFARIDLFIHGGTIYFGEITLHSHSGYAPFFPADFDARFGAELELPAP